MNVVHAGGTYQIYGESLNTYDKLPVRTYEVVFSTMSGFFLTAHNDLIVQEEKIYGSIPMKVEKVLRGFSHTDRNFGVILSGRKGIGKSLFARLLSVRAKDYSLPLIIVSEYVPGIANFLSSIDQEVIVLFDEFEKTFAENDECNPQEEMLSLFDGIDGGKKLFVITCNEVHKLNSYLINRPGRFHYHFTLGAPDADEIREYLVDKLSVEYHSVIDKIVGFSNHADLTYDILRALAFDINLGYSFEETLADINVGKDSSNSYSLTIRFVDGEVRTAKVDSFDFTSNRNTYVWLQSPTHPGSSKEILRIGFSSSRL